MSTCEQHFEHFQRDAIFLIRISFNAVTSLNSQLFHLAYLLPRERKRWWRKWSASGTAEEFTRLAVDVLNLLGLIQTSFCEKVMCSSCRSVNQKKSPALQQKVDKGRACWWNTSGCCAAATSRWWTATLFLLRPLTLNGWNDNVNTTNYCNPVEAFLVLLTTSRSTWHVVYQVYRVHTLMQARAFMRSAKRLLCAARKLV